MGESEWRSVIMKFLCVTAVLTATVLSLPYLHPAHRMKRQDTPAIPAIPDIPETFLGSPYGALAIANGVPYGALAISNTITGPSYWDIQVESEPQEDTDEIQTYSAGPPFWDKDAVQTYQASPVQPTTYKEGCQNAAGSIVPCAVGDTNILVHIGDLQSGVTQGAGVEAVEDRKRRET